MLLYSPGIEILETEHDLRRGKKGSVAVLCLRLFPSSTNVSSGIFILQSCSDGKGAARAKLLFCLLNFLLFAVIVAKALFVGEGVFHLIEAGYDLLLLTWV